MKEEKDTQEGENSMNAYAVKPNMPFIAKGKLERTPASESNRKMVEFMDSHKFSFSVDKNNKKFECKISNK